MADKKIIMDTRCYVPFMDLPGNTEIEEGIDAVSRKVIANNKLEWEVSETAIVVVDMWDKHWCKGATARVGELAPRINELVRIARSMGIAIIHAPSETMDYYKDSPARNKAQNAMKSHNLPHGITEWLHPDKAELEIYPVDQSDEGCDCKSKCAHGKVWTKQTDLIEINDKTDYVTDCGDEIWNLCEQEGLKNIILCGVHTNMCILGRPFGIRRMVTHGRNVVLIRDLTDLMYNSEMPPFANHFTGLDLIIRHIETEWCSTITSTVFTGKPQFILKEDKRKRINFIVAEGEYRSHLVLPEWAKELQLKYNFSIDYSIGKPYMVGEGRHNIVGLENLVQADLAVMMVRRRALEKQQLDCVKSYLKSGKPLLAIRPTSAAFDVENVVPNSGGVVISSGEKIPPDLVQWPEFEKLVIGGNYQGHHVRLTEGTDVSPVVGRENHPILTNIGNLKFNSKSWLYKNYPLKEENVDVLMNGKIAGHREEPVLWTHRYGKSSIVYTSLGHWDDWEIPAFKQLMENSVCWLLKCN